MTGIVKHYDDKAVDIFASAMKEKLAAAREKGRGGWNDPAQCSVEFLAELLLGHVSKGNAGNFEDIANLAMMLYMRGADPAVLSALTADPKALVAAALERAASVADGMARSEEEVNNPYDAELLYFVSKNIRALIDTDHAAALEAVRAEEWIAAAFLIKGIVDDCAMTSKSGEIEYFDYEEFSLRFYAIRARGESE